MEAEEVVVVEEVDLEAVLSLQWVSHSLISRPCLERERLYILYVISSFIAGYIVIETHYFGKPLEPPPLLTEPTEEELRICELQNGFTKRLRQSAYYIVESTKSTGR